MLPHVFAPQGVTYNKVFYPLGMRLIEAVTSSMQLANVSV